MFQLPARSQRQYPRIGRPHRKSNQSFSFECLEARELLATITVNTSADVNDPTAATMSLREAIEISNGTLAVSSLNATAQLQVSGALAPAGRPNFIKFDLANTTSISTIALGSSLPALTSPVVIDGYSQPGAAISPPDKTEVVINDARIQIDGWTLSQANPGTTIDGLDITSANCEVSGIIITGLSGAGISISGTGSQGNYIWGNFLGAYPDTSLGRYFEVNPKVLAAAGTPQPGNMEAGIKITSSNNRVGGSSPGLPNVIVNNGYDSTGNPVVGNARGVGVLIDTPSGTGNLIQGNAIFNNAAQGVYVRSSNNTIGEAIKGGGNSISDNGADGILITGGSTVQGNGVIGNFIGTDLGTPDGSVTKGTVRFANAGNGIVIIDSPKNNIGGYTGAARNIIGENIGDGVLISGSLATGNRLLNNYIGFNSNNGAISFLPNQNGVYITAPGNIIGDPGPTGGNTISNNRQHGIYLYGAAAIGNAIDGNIIGLDPTGGTAISNAFDGILIENVPNTIIGTTSGSRNVISSNNNGVVVTPQSFSVTNGADITAVATTFIVSDASLFQVGDVIELPAKTGGTLEDMQITGVNLITNQLTVTRGINGTTASIIANGAVGYRLTRDSATGTIIQGNFIGTASDGVTDLGNAVDGVILYQSPLNTIGGTASGAGNVISGNNRGVIVTGANSHDNLIQGNFIGTDLTATQIIHNEIDGVLISAGASNNSVGGILASAGNVIAFNVGAGVNLAAGTGNSVLSNRIFGNTGNGVAATKGSGVVLNTATNANNLQVPPTLLSAAPGTASTVVQGTFSGVPLKTYTIQLFSSVSPDPTGFGQGQNLILTIPATTDSTGTYAFSVTVPISIPSGQYITALATDPNGNTSTFSNAIPAAPIGLQLGSATYQANENDGVVAISIVRTGGMQGVVSVNYDVSGGTAVPGVDYTPVSGTITFNPGDPSTKTISVPIINAQKVGGSVTTNITLSNPTGGSTLGTPSTGVLTIIDNGLATIQMTGTNTASVKEDAGSISFIITRNSANGVSTINYATSDGTAKAGTNYTATSGTATFNQGESSKTVTVPILQDGVITGPLNFNFTLSNPSNAILGSVATKTVTIINVDSPGIFQVAASKITVNPGATSVPITVNRTSGAIGTVTVNYATGGGTAIPGIDYTTTSGTLTFGPGETSKVVTVPLLNVNVPSPDLTFNLVLSNPTGGATLSPANTTTVTVKRVLNQILTITVNTALDSTDPTDGLLSLREAIELSDGLLPISSFSQAEQALVSVAIAPPPSPGVPPLPNIINFNIPGTGLQTISVLNTPLPAITSPVTIDGSTQNGYVGNPSAKTDVDIADLKIQVDGHALAVANPGLLANGLTINTSNTTIDAMIFTGFTGAGVSISGAGSQGNWLNGNFFGTLPNPSAGRNFSTDPALANGLAGIQITSSNNRVGGNNPGLRNVIVNNAVGVILDTPQGTGNLIQNNFILDNAQQGVLVSSSNNTIGEDFQGGGNVISGNGLQGIEVTGGPNVQGNLILANEIGTDIGNLSGGEIRGGFPLPNGQDGILIENSPDNFIGALDVNSRNVIGGNRGNGITIDGAASTGNRISSNYIGFNIVNGLISLYIPNQNGIAVTSPGNYIGIGSASAQNTISNNLRYGILLTGAGASGNFIAGNTIGINPNGGSAFGNAFDGIHLDNAPNNTIGGVTVDARNVISSNNNGIYLLGAGSTGNIIEGNFIGTGNDGVLNLGNAVNGIVLDNAPLNTIGGTVTGAGNVISGNNRGVVITGAGALNNVLQGNFIGTDLTGKSVVNNKIDGVQITAGASDNVVGGLAPGAINTILFNSGAGVYVDSGTGNSILSNSIYQNTGHGIALNPINNANNLIQAPALTVATPTGTTTNVQGIFQGTPNATYTLQFFSSPTKDSSGFGQGQTPAGSFTITTNANGQALFGLTLPVNVTSGQFITSTLTDALGDTSAFSNAIPAVPIGLKLGSATYTVNETDGSVSITITRTGGISGTVAVNYAVGGGTAVPGVDYTAVSGTVTFNPGDPASKTFSVPILNAQKVGGSVTFNVTLSNPTNGATIGAPGTAIVTIVDNVLPGVQFSTSTASVNENAKSLTLTVNRNTNQGAMTIAYSTSNGTAVAGVNYTAKSGTLSFNSGDTSKNIIIPIIDDNVITGPLTFTVSLSNPTGGSLFAPTSTLVTINNTDTPGTLQVGSAFLTTDPGASVATLAVTRTGGAAGTVTVNYATGGGTAQPGIDYVPANSYLTFAPGEVVKFVQIPLMRTFVPGPDLTFLFAIGYPGGGAKIGPLNYTTVTIQHGPSPNGNTPGGPPPVITALTPVIGAGGITDVVVNFSKTMDVVHAQQVGNYGYFVTSTGADGIFGTYDDLGTKILWAYYDSGAQRTILHLASAIPLGMTSQIVIDRDASAKLGKGLYDSVGNLLDGTGTGLFPGSPYSVLFAAGTRLNYTDNSGDAVNLSLSGPGLMLLVREITGEAKSLRLTGTVPGTDTLSGTVAKQGRYGNGYTTIPVLSGTYGTNVKLRPPTFIIGQINASAFKRPSASSLFATTKRKGS